MVIPLTANDWYRVRATITNQGNNQIQFAGTFFDIGSNGHRDATTDIADELRRRYVEFGELPDSVLDFMDANRL